ncbi:MAG: LysR family transcriptional regulator [Firmicutes bacterium]|jgi:DNA-binding transcriptional LysR family regulator|nr:LysR family transcriptional regulator [Bacillota bacterium]
MITLIKTSVKRINPLVVIGIADRTEVFMEIRQLKIFMAVCDSMSFTRAAKDLSYSQSTISDNIKALEKSLGHQLFDRLGKKIYLTDKGKELKDLSKKLIEEYDYVLNTIQEKGREIITIGITETLCSYKLSDFFMDFLKKTRDVEIHFEIRHVKDITEMLYNNAIDIGFSLDKKPNDKNLKIHNLFDEEIVFVSSKKINDLNGESVIIPLAYESYMNSFHDYYDENNIKKGTVIHMESIEGIKNYVKSGFGISFMPITTVQKELDEGVLFIVDQKERFFMNVMILIHKDKQVSRRLGDLIDDITNMYR